MAGAGLTIFVLHRDFNLVGLHTGLCHAGPLWLSQSY